MKNHDILRMANQTSSARSIFVGLSYSVAALFLYSYASYQLDVQMKPLSERCQELNSKLLEVKQESQTLAEMVAYFADPAADEYALTHELGLIPKGSKKVLFTSPVPSP
jgi:hypothetical protein